MAGLPNDDNASEFRTTSGIAPARPPRPDRSTSIFRSLEAGLLVGGKYRLVRCLAEGGMATLWVAHNETLDIEVAIKFIRTDLTTPKLAERLLTEARAAAKLGHPAIVRVFDFGRTPRGDPYIVMELLDGEDLSTVYVESGRMAPIATLRTLLPIAHALAVAHDKGIVHRDLKPENVFLVRAEDGQVQPKLLDFGVAKLDAAGYERLTQAGTALGSPAYMSPEQARGEEVDPRSDLWSFCVVLYEAMSGTLPFHHENYNALMRRIIEIEPTPLPDLATGDSALWQIIEKGLTKELDQRWPSMRSLGAALAQWLIDRGVNEDLAGSSLAATWLQERQSWVDSDGVFERVIADSGLHPIAETTPRSDHPSKVETLPPPSRDEETPPVGTPEIEDRKGAETRPSVPMPSQRSFTVVRNVAITVVALVVIVVAASVLFANRAAPPPPAPEASPAEPTTAAEADQLRPAEQPESKPTAPDVAPAPEAEGADPATPVSANHRAPTAAAAPPPSATVLAPPAALATNPRLPSSAPPATPPPPAEPQPKSGGLEIKTSF